MSGKVPRVAALHSWQSEVSGHLRGRACLNSDESRRHGPGYDAYTDFYALQVRNDGVVVGQCIDEYYNASTGDYVEYPYGFVATPR